MFLHTYFVQPQSNYCLYVEFNNGAKGLIDLTDVLWGDMFETLKTSTMFLTATQNPVMGTVSWANGADLAPEFLYDLLVQQSLNI